MGIAAAVGLGIVAVLVFMIQPGYVQALVDLGRLSSETGGYVAASEMAGIAVTTITLSLKRRPFSWHPALTLFIFLQAVGNAACMADGSLVWLFGGRFVAGLGAGGLASLSFTAIGLARNPDRQFGLLIAWILSYGALGLFALPTLLRSWGLDAFYLAVTLVSLAGMALVRHMPARGGTACLQGGEPAEVATAARMLAIASMFAFFLACGLLWAYLSLIGSAQGLADQAIANGLSVSQFTGIAGALCATAVGSRFGRLAPLGGGLLACAVSAACLDLLKPETALLFGALVCLFNFAWNLVQPVYLAAGAALDPRGRLVTQMVGAQMTGLAAGPFLGATLVSGGFGPIVWNAAILLILAAALAACALVGPRTGAAS